MTEAQDLTYRISLEGPGITLNREISEANAVAVIGLLLGSRVRGESEAPQFRSGGRVSIREFLDRRDVKTSAQKILAIGEFLTEVGGRESFSKDEVRAEFRRAKEALPANFPRDFGSAVGSGWIAEVAESPGEYYVTKTGTEALESGFSTASGSVPRRSRASKKRRKNPAPEGERPNSSERKSASRRTAKKGAQASVRELADTDFFSAPRTIGDVQKHLEKKRVSKFGVNELSGPLGKLVREGVLDREKNADNVYEYTLS